MSFMALVSLYSGCPNRNAYGLPVLHRGRSMATGASFRWVLRALQSGAFTGLSDVGAESRLLPATAALKFHLELRG